MATKNNPSERLTYAGSGVDIDAGNALVEAIKPAAKATNRLGSMGGLGGFGGLFDLKACGYHDPILVSATDGVGTKLKVAQLANLHDSIGIDLVAMCVNDLIVQGAEPFFFLDYFACGGLDIKQATAVIQGIALGCKQAGCQLIGGETAEMPDMYAKGDYDLAGFSVGAVERDAMLPNLDAMKAGDVVIGIASSGLHSNGFSLVRKLVSTLQLDWAAPCPFDTNKTLAVALLEPTHIYVGSLMSAIKAGRLKALAHITGGGLIENIPRILPAHLACEIDARSWRVPPVFEWIASTKLVPWHDFVRTFNIGIGMVVIAAPDQADALIAQWNEAGEQAQIIGTVTTRADEAVHLANAWY